MICRRRWLNEMAEFWLSIPVGTLATICIVVAKTLSRIPLSLRRGTTVPLLLRHLLPFPASHDLPRRICQRICTTSLRAGETTRMHERDFDLKHSSLQAMNVLQTRRSQSLPVSNNFVNAWPRWNRYGEELTQNVSS